MKLRNDLTLPFSTEWPVLFTFSGGHINTCFLSTCDNTFYVNITDVTKGSISKIRKDKADPDRFYISKSGSSFENDYAAGYKNGRWVLKIISGITI